jgi:hypothetical protein
MPCKTTIATQVICFTRSSRTKDKFHTFLIVVDRIRTVLQRSKPNSCTALIGEQPNPWDLLQPRDAISRHRGAKQLRRCGLSRDISLLSLAYLLSVDRYPSPQRNTGSLWPAFTPARFVNLTVKLTYTIILNKQQMCSELTFAHPRYFLGGDRPSQTTHHTLFKIVS